MKKFYFFCVCFYGYLAAIYAAPLVNTSCLDHVKALATLETAEILLTKASASFPICSSKPIEKDNKIVDDKTVKDEKPRDCSEVLVNGNNESGIYKIWTDESFTTGKSLEVFCDMETDKGGWTVIQRRGKYPGRQEFNLGWESYKKGFGKLTEEFWLGNENIRVLCQKECEIRFDLQDKDGQKGYAHYETFRLEGGDYILHIDGYTGTAGNNIASQNDNIFVTKGDSMQKTTISGGWWHGNDGSYFGNINGIYKPGQDHYGFVIWYKWRRYENLAKTEMKVRPRRI